MKIYLNDVTGCSSYDGIHRIFYQGIPIKMDRDTYFKVIESMDKFNEVANPIRDKILELQREIYNYQPIEIEVS